MRRSVCVTSTLKIKKNVTKSNKTRHQRISVAKSNKTYHETKNVEQTIQARDDAVTIFGLMFWYLAYFSRCIGSVDLKLPSAYF